MKPGRYSRYNLYAGWGLGLDEACLDVCVGWMMGLDRCGLGLAKGLVCCLIEDGAWHWC